MDGETTSTISPKVEIMVISLGFVDYFFYFYRILANEKNKSGYLWISKNFIKMMKKYYEDTR